MSGEVAAGWTTSTLKEVAGELFTDGDWVESKDQDPDGEVRLIQLADIGDGTFLDKSARFLTAEKARQLRCTILRPGDLLIARMADPIARCCLFPGLAQPAATVVDVSIVRPGPHVDREYLAYAVSNPVFRSEAIGSASGTTRSRISRSNLGAITLPLPPLDEQRRIAEVLRSVDEAIAAVEAELRGLEGATTAFIEERCRAAESHGCFTIGDFATFVGSGVTPKGGKDAYTDKGIAFIRSQNVHFDGLRAEGLAFIDPATDAKMARTRVYADDVLLNITGASIGRCTVVPRGLGPANVNQHVCIIRPDPAVVLPGYLSLFLSSHDAQRQIDQLQGGLSREGLNFKQVRAISVPCPPPEVQSEIAEVMHALRSMARRLEEDLASKKAVRFGISDDLLSGRVRVPA